MGINHFIRVERIIDLAMQKISLNSLLKNHYSKIESLVKKRFAVPRHKVRNEDAVSGNLCDEALNYVLAKLEKESNTLVQNYNTIPHFWVQSRITDFIRHKYKQYGLPKWIKALGPLWEEVYKRLCWERMDRYYVIDAVVESAPGGRDPDWVEEVVDTILERETECGKQHMEVPVSALTDAAEGAEGNDAVFDRIRANEIRDADDYETGTPEDLVILRQIRAVIDYILGTADAENEISDQTLTEMMALLKSEAGLTEEDQLFLRLYTDGLGIVKAGELLGWQPDQAGSRYHTIKTRIRKAFEHKQLAPLDQMIRDFIKNKN